MTAAGREFEFTISLDTEPPGIAGDDALARLIQATRKRDVSTVAYASEIVNACHDPGERESDQAKS